MAKNTKTPVMVLQELSVKRNYAAPTYEIVYSITGTHENRFDYRVTVDGVEAEGTGSSKQIGKHNAAHNALMKLKDLGIYDPMDNPVQEFKLPDQNATPGTGSPFKTSPNCIGPLKDLCLEYKIPDPIFTLLSDVGPPHSREFTYECSVASIKTLATGNTKKMAKQLAAKDMLERIKDVMPNISVQNNVKEDQRQKCITDDEAKVLNTYNEFYAAIVPDKTVNLDEYSYTLQRIMKNNDLTFKNFANEFSERTEEALIRILDKLGLTHEFYEMHHNPIMICLSLSTDTPFTTIGLSDTRESARAIALSSAFEIMEMFMQL